jgi:hypothetical protein
MAWLHDFCSISECGWVGEWTKQSPNFLPFNFTSLGQATFVQFVQFHSVCVCGFVDCFVHEAREAACTKWICAPRTVWPEKNKRTTSAKREQQKRT